MEHHEKNKKQRINPTVFRKEILEIINKHWPVHASGICKVLHIKPTIANIAKVGYHIKQLHKKEKVNVKKIDRALVAWPKEIEKLRFIHDFMKEE